MEFISDYSLGVVPLLKGSTRCHRPCQFNSRSKRFDAGPFCTATIRCMESLASLLNPHETCFLSQDEKARVLIGITVANKQSPMIMHVEYRVSLPDHDWVVSEQHKLIPFVYAGIEIQHNGLRKPEAVGYSGPKYIAISSGKHCSSTAFAHWLDFGRLSNVQEFEKIMKSGPEKSVKPVIFITVNGNPLPRILVIKM